ncbi:Aldo/keto reductase [Ascobolus immersus RN42]|uniref:Aldo/keto reductase n=1 Tax=Ascobolus immersus RN42 TaxID=1160509 RepID=A0A3N4HYJ9_ASCIM|nr:Aldo/keto reductase [Ascobolus immersus RN42]
MTPKTYPYLHLPHYDFCIPALGYGTYFSPRSGREGNDGSVKRSVLTALKAGYRHIDTAALYECEEEVGEALREWFDMGGRREEVFVTTKFWNQNHSPLDVLASLTESLARLQLDYVDLYLMHWPISFNPTPLPASLDAPTFDTYDPALYHTRPIATLPNGKPSLNRDLSYNHISTWEAMEELYRRGLCRNIGVSNFTVKGLMEVCEYAEVKPVVNQVELHPYLPQPELLQFCKERDIILCAYSPLGSQTVEKEERVIADPVVRGIAEKRGCTEAQVLLSWAILHRGTVALPMSSDEGRIRGNSVVVELTEEEYGAIDGIEKRKRFVNFDEEWGVREAFGHGIFEYQ